ncbi:hypothetical protein EPN52_06050 [bacterium]|nr:MAG: hypothetical protein EPN52_06050 [bacterium]
MNCRACDQRLGDYLDGALDVYALARVERHLACCANCRALLAELRNVESMLSRGAHDAALEPARNFTAAVMAEVCIEARPHAQPVLRWAFLGWYLLGAWALIGALAVVARPLLTGALHALAGAGGAVLSIAQALTVAVGVATGGHAAAIAAVIGFVLIADALLAFAIYFAHTRLELA